MGRGQSGSLDITDLCRPVGDRTAEHLPEQAVAAAFELLGQLIGDRDRFGGCDREGCVGLLDVELVGVPVDRQPVMSVGGVDEDAGELRGVVPPANPPARSS